MAYDIPDEIKYREKIVANLDGMQLIYGIGFALLILAAYRLPFEGDLKLLLPSLFAIIGIGFVFFKFDEKFGDIIAYYMGLRKAGYDSKTAQEFFGVNEIRDDLVSMDDGRLLAVFEIRPVNFMLLDEGRKRALIANYKAFLNQLTVPVQILIRTNEADLEESFSDKENCDSQMLTELRAEMRVFEEEFLEKNNVREREYYLVLPYQPVKTLRTETQEKSLKRMEELVEVTLERLQGCGLDCRRLSEAELLNLFMTYADVPEDKETETENGSQDEFRNTITPSFDIRKDCAFINGEMHKFVKVVGFPRKVEDGWLQAFLTENENYDISIHIHPSTINAMLVYLHNQIIQQTGDLIMSTSKGTPNPALEIKKNDTMKVYDSIYKGEEKAFSVSVYIDNKAENQDDLDLLTEKCKSSLNARMMIPKEIGWRIADCIKSTLPLALDKLVAVRDFLTNSLSATFPFISSVTSGKKGLLFGHETETLVPIFIDPDKLSNKHFFVIGISGSGKSYTSKYLLMQQLFRERTKVFVLDPNGEYSGLCEALGGQTVILSRGSKSMINIFDLCGEDYGDKMLSLISAFDIIVGGLTESQKGILNKALTRCYSNKGILFDVPDTWKLPAPTFTDVRSALLQIREELEDRSVLDPSAEALLNRVELYCTGGLFGFMDGQSNLDISKGIVCFDLSRLPQAVKTLLMFATLEIIKRKISEDKSSKVVLIDEGWSLLRSSEAASYILEFVKSSRKFNTALGFITQEIEDLLKSKTGKSILNTTSTKILMRQNPTNIDLIAESLKLNEQCVNYLLTAKNGHGLLITENNTHKFFVSTPMKLHEVITTHPKDASPSNPPETKPEVPRPKSESQKAKPKMTNLTKGIYPMNSLNPSERAQLLARGYKIFKGRLTREGGNPCHLVRLRHNEGKEHAFFCWTTYYLLKEHFEDVSFSPTSSPDIGVTIKGRKIAFEIETGHNLDKKGQEMMEIRLSKLRETFDEVYIIVSSWREGRRYHKFGNVITRTDIEGLVTRLAAA